MAERLPDITARIENVKQLRAVTTAMRGIAAARAQQSKGLLAGIGAYAEAISRAIGQTLNFVPFSPTVGFDRASGRALILFCAEQGFAGALSDRILDAAGRDIAASHLMLIGTRGAGIARERGLNPGWMLAMASQVGAVAAVANRVAEALYALIAKGAIARAEVVFAHLDAAHVIGVERKALFPLDLERFRQKEASIPLLTTLELEVLIERLAVEYIYAVLCEAAMHAFAAENQARMEAMGSVANNIDRTLCELQQRENQVRQEEVTAEIVELASSVEAVGKL